MKKIAGAGAWLVVVVSLVACDREREDAQSAPAPTAKIEKQATAPAGTRPTWPSSSCTILATESVAKVMGKTVKPREQYATCDYLTGQHDDVSVQYANNKYGGGEYEIFKGLQDERGGKSTPVSGLGKEALEGNTGTGGGLGVQMVDGRSFLVEGGTKEQRIAIARLVLAVR